ncbi:MAG: hypothetical protein Q7U57_07065 [Methylovulum sp.]|nr:hypothetical protein [Methylovulum sp.]
MSGNQYELYRFTHSDGTTKDWAVRANRDGSYTSRWGKTGTRLQSKTFQNMLPMQDHIREKTNKGYKLIGMVFIDDDGKVSRVPPASSSKPMGKAPHQTQESLHIYWRIKIQNAVLTSPELPFLKGKSAAFSVSILQEFPDCSWVKNVAEGHGDFIQTGAGFLTKEHGVGSLLLLMALKKHAPEGIAITMSHEDGLEISDHVNFETEALSFFDSNLESIRPLAEDLELLVKKIDLSTIESSYDDYFF